MLGLFEMLDTDSVHAVIISGPDSRFIDKSLWPLAMERRLWAITGWPYLNRKKTNAVIAEYDRRVTKNLEAARAIKVLQLSNFAIYRIDRAPLLAHLADTIPVTDHIDFGFRSTLLWGIDYRWMTAGGWFS